MRALASVFVGGVLVAAALAPMDTPYIPAAAYLEWAGAFLAFMGLTLLFGPKLSTLLSTATFLIGSLLDGALLSFNPIGWTLTNYMVYVHMALGISTGLLIKQKVIKQANFRRSSG